MPSGRVLPPGLYPRIVTWPQGFTQRYKDLVTGASWQTFRKTEWTKSPHKGLRIVRLGKTPPRRQKLEMGIVDVHITPEELRYQRSKAPARRRFPNPFSH